MPSNTSRWVRAQINHVQHVMVCVKPRTRHVTLQGVKERRNLTALPEIGLSNAVPESKDVRRYGHLVHTALTKVRELGHTYTHTHTHTHT